MRRAHRGRSWEEQRRFGGADASFLPAASRARSDPVRVTEESRAALPFLQSPKGLADEGPANVRSSAGEPRSPRFRPRQLPLPPPHRLLPSPACGAGGRSREGDAMRSNSASDHLLCPCRTRTAVRAQRDPGRGHQSFLLAGLPRIPPIRFRNLLHPLPLPSKARFRSRFRAKYNIDLKLRPVNQFAYATDSLQVWEVTSALAALTLP